MLFQQESNNIFHFSDHESEIPSESLSDTCTCQLPHHKLVVDVHQGGGVAGAASGGRCPKHNKLTTDRIQARCHSESDRQLQRNDQLDNCDRYTLIRIVDFVYLV